MGATAAHTHCRRCATELPAHALACPMCGTLVHSEELQRLASTAEEQTRAGAREDARASWHLALGLLPPASGQYGQIEARISALDHGKEASTRVQAPGDSRPWWQRTAAIALAILLLFAGKLKFLLFGLSKSSTLFSMFAFAGVYCAAFGWKLAAGLVAAIYVHEMGHVAALRRYRIPADAPMFIPGLGAVVRSRMVIADARIDARVGLAGPIWGLGVTVAAYLVFLLTDAAIWAALAHLSGFVNLFNLIPVWQLDGARGMRSLDRTQRWLIVAAAVLAFLIWEQLLLVPLAGFAVYQAWKAPATNNGDTVALLQFVGLIIALTAFANVVAVPR